MEINKDCNASTSDFWYDLTDGGYLDPYEICENKKDAEKVVNAIQVVREFYNSCCDQIDEFLQ